jgi:hypothetical protein
MIVTGIFLDITHYSPDYDPAITYVVKRPVLDLLSTIATSTKLTAELDEQHESLVAHTPPDVLMTCSDEVTKIDGDDLDAYLTTIETPGMTCIYYWVLDPGVVNYH